MFPGGKFGFGSVLLDKVGDVLVAGLPAKLYNGECTVKVAEALSVRPCDK